MQLAEAHASAAAAESQETIMSEALKEAKDRHVHQLRVAYLVTRAERRTLAAERKDAPILEGTPISPNTFINESFIICCHSLYINTSSCH